MRKVRGIIALDLDGTLLTPEKRLTTRNLYAMENAAELGWEIVPTTGRFYNGMPEFIRELPFVNYAITINGAQVIDLKRRLIVYEAEMPYQQAVKIMEYLDDYPVVYDCYMGGKGWMSESHKERIDSIVADPHSRQMLRDLRQSVPDLKQFLLEEKQDVQKVQFFIKDDMQHIRMMYSMPNKFKDVAVTTALDQNIEITHEHANKGDALIALAQYLGVEKKDTVAIGDGHNDLPMIRIAGTGVAMTNGIQQIKDEADWVTLSNDKDGVASAIEKFCLE